MKTLKEVRIAVIGGGPAGLSAAVSACDELTALGGSAEDILILERDQVLGGILNQCIHNGFGLHTFKEELTGPEYAARYIEKALERQIPCLTGTIVVNISQGEDGVKYIDAMNREEGYFRIKAGAVILAMGCRERPRGALNTPGYRPAGIYTAGTAQRFVNIEGRMPGREVVILGSGDIGLIMARRMTLEGAKVKCVAELMPYSGGLKRNIVQCLDDFGIPLKLSHTVIDIAGRERVESVTIAEVGPDRRPIPGTEEVIPCDTLLLSCGLIPENELSEKLGVALSPVTSGPVVNESLETGVPGVFACGNVLHVHDLVDYVSEEAAWAGRCAAQYVSQGDGDGSGAGDKADEEPIRLVATGGVRYTVPMTIRLSRMDKLQTVRFRVGDNYRDARIVVEYDGHEVRSLKKRVLAPGEMEQLTFSRDELEKSGVKEIRLSIAQQEGKS